MSININETHLIEHRSSSNINLNLVHIIPNCDCVDDFLFNFGVLNSFNRFVRIIFDKFINLSTDFFIKQIYLK